MKDFGHERDIPMTLSIGDSNHPEYNHFIDLAEFFAPEVPSGQHGCLAHKVMGDSLCIMERELSGRQVLLHLMKQISQ